MVTISNHGFIICFNKYNDIDTDKYHFVICNSGLGLKYHG